MCVVRAGDISEFELMGNHMRGLATPDEARPRWRSGAA
jgi:hypothetical protein